MYLQKPSKTFNDQTACVLPERSVKSLKSAYVYELKTFIKVQGARMVFNHRHF